MSDGVTHSRSADAHAHVSQTRPLGWNGLLAYLIPSIAYVFWKIATPYVLLKAITNEEKELAGEPEAEPETV